MNRARLPDGPGLAEFMPGAKPGIDGKARAGVPLPNEVPIATDDAVIEGLSSVYDPELPVNIYDLGLIYDFDINPRGNVKVTMTLTAPACPVAGILPQQVAEAVAKVPGVGQVEVELVWDPPWTKERMSEDARLALDLF